MAKISTSYARQLAKNYRLNKLGKTILADETQGVWYPKETILEALGLPTNTPCEYSGLRFYLGAYEDEEQAPADYPKNREYCNKITLVIVQTKEVGNEHKDDLDKPKDGPAYPKPPFKEFDDGQLCPPPKCDTKGLLNF